MPPWFLQLLPPVGYPHLPASSFATKFVHQPLHRVRSPVNTMAWMPEGRRLLCGLHSGEFMMWNGLSFQFETVLQVHAKLLTITPLQAHDVNMCSGCTMSVIVRPDALAFQ